MSNNTATSHESAEETPAEAVTSARAFLTQLRAWTPDQIEQLAQESYELALEIHDEFLQWRLSQGYSIESSQKLVPPPKRCSGAKWRARHLDNANRIITHYTHHCK